MTTSLISTTEQSATYATLYDIVISAVVRFWNCFIPNILSIIYALVALYHLLADRTLRQAPSNRFIVILFCVGLFYELTTVLFMLHFCRVGYSWKITSGFANFWTFIDNSPLIAVLIGFAGATIERYILIFYHSWMTTKRQYFLVDYFPLIIVLTYRCTHSFFVVRIPTCQNRFLSFPMNTYVTVKHWINAFLSSIVFHLDKNRVGMLCQALFHF